MTNEQAIKFISKAIYPCSSCESRDECHRGNEALCDGAMDMATAALRAQDAPNPPLTLEELRGLDGEPVWIVETPDWGHWELSENAEDYFDGRDADFYGMSMPPSLPDPMGRYGLHMMGWLAYRRKPEEETR